MSTGQGEAERTQADRAGQVQRPLPRWSLTSVAGVHGLLFAWAGTKLPWSEWSNFAIVCYLLAFAHLLTAVAAAAKLRVLVPIWRVSSVLALIVLGWLAWELSSSAAYLAGLYGDLGEGLGAALLAVVGLVALPTLPLACWGLAATWRRSYNPGAIVAVPLLLTIWTLGALHQADAAAAERMPLPGEIDRLSWYDDRALSDAVEVILYEQIEAEIDHWARLPEIPVDGPIRKVEGGYRHAKLRVPSLMTSEPIACVPDPAAAESVAVLTYLRRLEGPPARPKVDAPVEVVSRCIRAAPEQIAAAIVDQIQAEAMRGPVKIDLIRGVAPLRSRSPVLDMFALRPGLDGVCDEDHCLMPWQLVALDQFIVNEPLPWIPDFRFGVAAVELRRALGFEVPEEVLRWDRERRNPKRRKRMEEAGKVTPKPADADSWRLLDGLTRIETLSFVVTENGLFVSLVRMHQRELKLSKRRLDYAREIAERHIAQAQLKNGRFRYTLHPFTGRQRTKNWNLPRQAGTTLVACELGQNKKRTRRVAARSLAYMAKHARESGELVALSKSKAEAHLGSTALPAIAFYGCRPHLGTKHDALIAGLTRFLLAMQRDDGSFYPQFDLRAGEVIDGPEPMYAGGQAIFALSLAEKLALEDPEAAAAAGLPTAEVLRDAVERAMNFYTGPYWDTFVRDFFWLEENWHCLAARASLGHHRNDAYERYCLDYMEFKTRLILDEDSDVAREFYGSYSFSNLLTPVNTPAAGYGEGLAAAMALAEARGEDLEAKRERMREVITFLLRQQWSRDNCFACTPDRTVLGGFSESMSAPEIRIDYTQHAWAALGHGGAWIYDELPEEFSGDP
jgi:hypothetical protein